MFKKALAMGCFAALSMIGRASAVEVPVVGNVAAKCVIVADTSGVYGNPTPNELSTDAVDGGSRTSSLLSRPPCRCVPTSRTSRPP